VDELMSYYKEEIIRFALESHSFQSDFSAYIKKFTKAYRILKSIPISNQDKAIEILNMPYKEYRQYKDWSDNVIVDSEEVDMVRLRVFNDPESKKILFENLGKYSKMRSIQSSENITKLYEFVDLKNFLIFNETRTKPKVSINVAKEESLQIIEEDSTPKQVFDQGAYLSRAVLKRKVRLTDVKKMRNDYKFLKSKKFNDNMSFVIAAFQQTFNKILPKPADFISEFMVMVSALLRQLSEIRLFSALRTFKNQNVIQSLESFKTLKEDFTIDANKVELYIYRVQQCVDELKTDIKILKNEAQEKESLKRVCDFSTTMAHDAIKVCIRESLEDLMTNFEEYYALLPLPTISKEINDMLPPYIQEQRTKYREKFCLPDEEFYELTTESEKEASETTNQAGATNSDGNMIKAVVIGIMEDLINGGTFFKQGFIPFESLRVKPFFLIKHIPRTPHKNNQFKQKFNH